MFACVDVDYRTDAAFAACVTFRSWSDEICVAEHVARIESVEPYVPGQFYRRELPCILEVIKPFMLANLNAIVIDGYVWLHDEYSPGLGAHLFDALNHHLPVIGVAKNSFAGANMAKEVIRGTSRNPLYVTAAGVAPETAADYIKSMHGEHRIPTLLKQVDRLAREAQVSS